MVGAVGMLYASIFYCQSGYLADVYKRQDVKFIEDQARIRPQNSEVFRLWGDNTKVKSLTGYEPSYSLEEGLKETINWFLDKDNLRRYKADIYNV